MSAFGLSASLGGIILAILVVRAAAIMRRERDAGRGAEPGTGYHVLRSDYSTGGGGGGDYREYRVPGDPQDYARLFVPPTPNNKDRTI